MLDFITAPLIVWICFAGLYKLAELFVKRKERLILIEKLGHAPDNQTVDENPGKDNLSFTALRLGCLLTGVGLGLLLGLLLNVLLIKQLQYYVNDDKLQHGMHFLQNMQTTASAYGASVLLCGGLGLLTAFIIEIKMKKKNKDKDNKDNI
jgi:tetrahydromethanopterin S-methyltransferase subunit B